MKVFARWTLRKAAGWKPSIRQVGNLRYETQRGVAVVSGFI